MKTVDRIPRNLIQTKITELMVGEGTWADSYDFHITENGRVFLKKDVVVWPVRFDDWAQESRQNQFFVERVEDGFRMHILTRDTITPTYGEMERDEYLKIEDIVLHEEHDEVCPSCQGAGIINLTGNMPQGIRDMPHAVLKRLEDQLDRLEVFVQNSKDVSKLEHLKFDEQSPRPSWLDESTPLDVMDPD